MGVAGLFPLLFLVVVAPAAALPEEPKATQLTRDVGQNYKPAWSPDGSHIAFESNRNGNLEIYVMNADGSHQFRLTRHPDADYGPSWTPDGSRILFSRFENGHSTMWSMKPDGTDIRPMRTGKNTGFRPSMSPDGTQVAFDDYIPELKTHQVFVMDADGENVARLTETSAYESGPDWSPDGSHLVFFSTRDFPSSDEERVTPSEIYLMNNDGTGQTRLTILEAKSKYPHWAADGKRIAFESNYGGNDDIFIIQSDGSSLKNLTRHPAVDSNFAWSPDGTHLAFTSNRDGNFNIFVLDVTVSQQ